MHDLAEGNHFGLAQGMSHRHCGVLLRTSQSIYGPSPVMHAKGGLV